MFWPGKQFKAGYLLGKLGKYMLTYNDIDKLFLQIWPIEFMGFLCKIVSVNSFRIQNPNLDQISNDNWSTNFVLNIEINASISMKIIKNDMSK